MKAITIGYLGRSAGLLLLMAICATRAEAQDCQALLRQILSGGSNVPWGMAAADEYNRKCLGQPTLPQPIPQPTYNPPTYNPEQTYNPQGTYEAPIQNNIANLIFQEASKLGEFIIKVQPLRENIPLSSGTKMMELYPAPPPAPTGYIDPFAAGTFPPIKQSTSGPVKSYGSIWDPSQWATLSPPAEPSTTPEQPKPSSGPCGPYAAQTGVCSGPYTGFDRDR
jgi:hypothetical protein